LNTFQNAIYLACSWLWCLGGFFPLILGRDYGWPALVAFTVFNIGGAIAMGFYFKQRTQQQQFEHKHKSAIALFSYITIAYQLFFVSWLGFVVGLYWLLPAVLFIGLMIYFSKAYIKSVAIIFYVLSIALFILFLNLDLPPVDLGAKLYWPHAVLPLAIGFILSPYLDITFHRAYKQSHHPKLSFLLGFGVFFLSLLFFVFNYAASLGDIFFNQAVPASIIYPVIAFLVLQTSFTIAAHCSELKLQDYIKGPALFGTIGGFSAMVLAMLFFFQGSKIYSTNLPFEETLYKSFLFFYSLVFPLYLMIRKSTSRYLWALAICTPAYALGFLVGGQYSYFLSIGVACIVGLTLLSRQTVRTE
jgi:hypothetical protein